MLTSARGAYNWRTSGTNNFIKTPLRWGAPTSILMNKISNQSAKNKRRTKTGSKRQNKNKTKGTKQPVRMWGGSVTTTVDSFLPVFPNITTRRLRYAERGAAGSTSGVVGTYVFTLSGLYDPNISGTGHQPMGFDEIMPFYEHYHVLRADVHVTFEIEGNGKGFVALKITPDTSVPADPLTLIEEGRNVVDYIDATASANASKVLRASVNVPGVMGLTRRNFLADTDTGGAIRCDGVPFA